MSKSGSKSKRRSRVEAADAREFAGRVHVSESPVLFREYVSRAEANSRCWEWNKARPVFDGLGVEFFVGALDESDRSRGWGVFGRSAVGASEVVVESEEFGPLLKLVQGS